MSGIGYGREVAGEVVRQVRRHDLPFYAAGLTFYAGIAVVPLLLVAWPAWPWPSWSGGCRPACW